MRFSLDAGAGLTVRGYTETGVIVGEVLLTGSFVLTPERLHDPWMLTGQTTLQPSHCDFLVGLQPEVVIFGTGRVQRFPVAATIRPLAVAGIGFEAMTTAAACRTYNILCNEGRKVALAVMQR